MFLTPSIWLTLNIFKNNAHMFIIENIQARMDHNEFAAGVFVDVKKAFEA